MDNNPSLYLYMDTSALLKLYVEERFSNVVERAADEARDIMVSDMSYLEARASFARLREDNEIVSDEELQKVVDKLDEDWTSAYVVSWVSQDLIRAAAGLADKHRAKRLRSYDALHLATVLNSFEDLLHAPDETEVRFLAFDRNLVKAAREEVDLYFDPFEEQLKEASTEEENAT